jgi:parvulin-like peptidyl-prolyl isomerase
MSWRAWAALSGIAAGLAGGCTTAEPVRAREVAIAAPASPPAGDGVTRSQKPESPPSGTLLGSLAGPAGERAGAHRAASIRATVNGEAILDEDVLATAASSLAGARTAAERQEIFRQSLDHLIEREVVYQDAAARITRMGPQGNKLMDRLKEAAGKEFEHQTVRPLVKANRLKDADELDALLKANGLSLEKMKHQFERSFVVQAYLASRIEGYLNKVGHKEIADYFERHPEEFQVADGVAWQDLFVDALKHPSREAAAAFAEVLAGRIRRGEDFGRLCEQYDNGDSALRGHEGAGHKKGEIRPPEAEPVLFRMKEGEVAVVEIGSGFHIVRLAKRTYAGPLPFDEKVQKQIKEKLRGEVSQREIKRIVNDLKRKAVIDVAPAAE